MAMNITTSLLGRASKHITSMTRSTTVRRSYKLPKTATRTPWLRLPNDMSDSSFVDFENFYNIVDKELVKLPSTDVYSIDPGLICFGSSRESLGFLCQNSKMFVGHPHTGDGGGKDYFFGDEDDDKDPWDFSNKGPHSSARFFIVVGNAYTVLSYPRYHPRRPTPKDYHDFYVQWPINFRSWTRYPDLFHKDDPPIVYCKKTKTVYKLNRYGREDGPWVVQLWDMTGDDINVTSQINITINDSSCYNNNFETLRARCHQDRYLVLTGDEGGRGDPVLYLVVRHHNRELGVSETRAVDVFRFDLVQGKMSYTRKVDGHAFFIGQGSDSFAIPVEQCPGLKPDSIYVADDLRVFDLKDGSVTCFLDTGDLAMTRFQSFWVSPALPPRPRRFDPDPFMRG